MKVLRHPNVSEDFKIQVRAKLVEGLNKVLAEAHGVKKARAALSAGGKIMKVIESFIRALTGHERILQLRVAHMPNSGTYAPPAAHPEAPYAARVAGRREWKPLMSVFDISSRWIWFVPS